jgi:hypothetical protein
MARPDQPLSFGTGRACRLGYGVARCGRWSVVHRSRVHLPSQLPQLLVVLIPPPAFQSTAIVPGARVHARLGRGMLLFQCACVDRQMPSWPHAYKYLSGFNVAGEKPPIAVGAAIQLSPLNGHAFLRSVSRPLFRSLSNPLHCTMNCHTTDAHRPRHG